jgi:hypothetical protein
MRCAGAASVGANGPLSALEELSVTALASVATSASDPCGTWSNADTSLTCNVGCSVSSVTILIVGCGSTIIRVEPVTTEVVAESFVSSTCTSIDGGDDDTCTSSTSSPDMVSTDVLNTPFSQDTIVLG